MGIEHRIDGQVVELFVQGSFTIDELLSGFRCVLRDARLPPNAHLLIDVTASEEIPPLSVVERIAAILCMGRAKLAPRVAVLVAHTVRYGRARQLGAMLESGGLTAQPFYERSKAVSWLLGQDG
jgi:hypothetical protein